MAIAKSKYTQQITNFGAVRHDQQSAYCEKRKRDRKDDAPQTRFVTCTVRTCWAFTWKVHIVVIVLAWMTSLLVTIHVHSACGGLAGDGGHGGCWLNFETLEQLNLKVRWVLLRENFGCAWLNNLPNSDISFLLSKPAYVLD